MKIVKVTFEGGNIIRTLFNGTAVAVREYYRIGRPFNLGDGAGGDKLSAVSAVDLLPCPRCQLSFEVTSEGICQDCVDAQKRIAAAAAGLVPAPAPAATLKINRSFPLADKPPGASKSSMRCRVTGEFRPPRKGEWYLSGSIPAGYQAKADMQSAYHLVYLYTPGTASPAASKLCPHCGSPLPHKSGPRNNCGEGS